MNFARIQTTKGLLVVLVSLMVSCNSFGMSFFKPGAYARIARMLLNKRVLAGSTLSLAGAAGGAAIAADGWYPCPHALIFTAEGEGAITSFGNSENYSKGHFSLPFQLGEVPLEERTKKAMILFNGDQKRASVTYDYTTIPHVIHIRSSSATPGDYLKISFLGKMSLQLKNFNFFERMWYGIASGVNRGQLIVRSKDNFD